MAMAVADPLTLRNTLKTLCTCGDGWSYAVFWRFHPQNSLLLTVEDAYYEEHLGQEIANMLPQVHLLGEGIVGQAASTGKHRWVHSPDQTEEWNLTGQHICEDDSGLHQQFSSGIKTIVLISVLPWGVVQFGSKKKILERVEFLEQIQRLLMGIEDMGMLDVSANTVLSPNCEDYYDLDRMLASISSENSYDWNLKSAHGDNSKELLAKAYSSASPDNSLPSIYKIHEGMTPLQGDDSCLGDQLKATIETKVLLSDRDSTDVFLKPNSSMNSLTARKTCFGSWSGEVSSLDLSGQQLLSEIRAQDVADVCSTEANAFASRKLTVQDSALTSLCSMNGGKFQDKLGNSLDNQYSAQSSIVKEVTFPESLSALPGLSNNLKPFDMSEDFSEFSSMDDLCQWLDPSAEDSICRSVIALDNTLSQSIEFNPTSFGLVESSAFSDIPVTFSTVHSSNTAAVNLDRQESSLVMHSSENSLFGSMGLDLSCDQAEEWWGNILKPVVSDATDTGFTESISELNISTLTGTQKGLFSELGIEELLSGNANNNSLNSSNFQHPLSPFKRQRIDFSHVNKNPIQVTDLARSGARADVMHPVSDLDKTNNLVHKKEMFPKLQVGLWIDDRHSINAGRIVPARPEKSQDATKSTRKRAKPGESTRPRPKDRQQIQDCIRELRGIIPNGGKCSIDSLLDRTIRYMIFLQSITKYADKLQEPNKPKLIDQGNGVVLEDSIVGDSKSDGATWALEVAGQRMVCPIIVEDMSPPGQMLIEMICEQQGFFLEIVDMIRGFGLNILKGKMEIRENKIWARFIVEANSHVTRIDVFWSLLHLLQQTKTSGVDSANNKHCNNVIDADISSLDNYQKTDMPLLMAMTETLG